MWIQYCLCFVALAVLCAQASPDWHSFKTSHGKTYSSAKEEAKRKELFMKTDAAITAHNKQNNTWKMEHNKFSDLSSEEMNKYYGIQVPKNITRRMGSLQSTFGQDIDVRANLPASVDYRQHQCMPPVKNQGTCGSCWAFTSINPMEFANCRKRGNKLTVLSEQQLVDCAYVGVKITGCKGGWMSDAYDYFLELPTGSATQASYPYTADGSSFCSYNSKMKGTQLADYQMIGSAMYEPASKVTKKMMQALADGNTIGVAFHTLSDWKQYKSGVYIPTQDCTGPATHGVVIVGYGTENNMDHWIIRNSWAATWGDKGYFKMIRGVNLCGIENSPHTVTVI